MLHLLTAPGFLAASSMYRPLDLLSPTNAQEGTGKEQSSTSDLPLWLNWLDFYASSASAVGHSGLHQSEGNTC